MRRIIIRTQIHPVEHIRNVFYAVALHDAVAALHADEFEEDIGQLVGGLREVLGFAVDHVNAPVLVITHDLHDLFAEAGKVTGAGRNAPDDAFKRGVAPRLIVARENAQMAAADKLPVIESK